MKQNEGKVPASFVSMIDDRMEGIVQTIMNADSNVFYFRNDGKDRTGVLSEITRRWTILPLFRREKISWQF